MIINEKYIHTGLTQNWTQLADKYKNITAIIDRYNNFKFTYKELYQQILIFASGLQSLGLKKDDHVSLFSENSSKWLIADQAILMCGAVNAVRGSQTPAKELLYILEHSDSKGLIAENLACIEELKEASLNFIICLSNEDIPEELKEKHNIYSFNEVLNLGKKQQFCAVDIDRNDIATLIYTSGTTGKPKGVMLTHGNLLSQIEAFAESLGYLSTGERSLNILPTWHVYERTCEYYLLSRGITMVYTNVAKFKDDIKRYNPNCLVAVPRIWEALYNGIHIELKKLPIFRKNLALSLIKTGESHIKSKRIINNRCINTPKCNLKATLPAFIKFCLTYPAYKLGEKLIYGKIRSALGSDFKLGISGGGALASYLEDFFEAIGVNIIVGYGLTESSPVLTLRRKNYNIRNSAGQPILNTEIKLQDGIVFARGPQVMKGYYKDKTATDEILSPDGWLNTGDLGWMTPENDLVLTGRCKDIIVLSNGENIEPQPIENALLQSPYISQIMLVGQDKAHLGALIVPDTNVVTNPNLHKVLKKELKELCQKRENYRSFEQIQCFRVLDEPFSVENGLLTPTMKIKKTEVQKKYSNLVEQMFMN